MTTNTHEDLPPAPEYYKQYNNEMIHLVQQKNTQQNSAFWPTECRRWWIGSELQERYTLAIVLSKRYPKFLAAQMQLSFSHELTIYIDKMI